jgi:AAA15 family ATPase/GTPase
MVAADLTRPEDCDRGVIETMISGASEPLKLLRSVAIYGPNASGKSTVLMAGHALRWLGTESSASAKPDANIPPYEPFLLDAGTRKEPVELGCDVVYRTSILRYQIKFKSKTIVSETLTKLTNKREAVLIDRQPSGEILGDLIVRSNANQLYVKEMQPNVSVLSKLAQHGPHKGKESVQPYYKAIRNATRFADYSDAAEMQIKLGESGDDRFADDQAYREWIMQHLIRSADMGICDVRARRETLKIPEELKMQMEKSAGGFQVPDTRVVISFIHQGRENSQIDFSNESAGTKKLFNISGDWWTMAHQPVTILADELSACLHPRLLVGLIRAVNESSNDRVNSQLVFTTHDTGLLESQDGQPPALRRDQVYFTKKNRNGASELYSLMEFKDDARPVHNLRKRYLSGLYGAIPSLETLSL